jgi:hypothetical protein
MTNQDTATDTQSRAAVVCADCDREIEMCCFCQDEDCRVAVCDPCMRTALHESMKQPHAHGG